MVNDITRAISHMAFQTYERQLLKEVLGGPIPGHLAVIMDGNRRFARELGIESAEGHLKGRDKLEEVMDWCLELGINIVTVFAFSTENLRRRTDEVEQLMALFAENFRRAGDDERAHRYGIRVKAIGQLDLLPQNVQDAIAYAEERTADYSNYYYNIAIAYGGREEIVNSIRRIASDVKEGNLSEEDIDASTVARYLYTADLPDPDLVLRTSGEERVSNFLLWQLAYSELYFADIYWPGFRKIDFLRAIRSYQKRQRRYGE